MRLYIAGPMTGIVDLNFPAFHLAERRLKVAGHDPVSPADNGGGEEGKTWADYIRLGLNQLLTCEGIALLPGWRESKGARLEVLIAGELGMPVKPIEDWLREE